MVATNDRTALEFILTEGEAHDAPSGRLLLETIGKLKNILFLLMDLPIVPPKKNRKNQWDYDRELYKKGNEVERLFCRLKAFRRIFSRFDKLDYMFIGFIELTLIFVALK